MAQRYKVCSVTRQVMCSTPIRGNEMLNLFYFAVMSRQSAALCTATQQPMPLEFGGNRKRYVLTLGKLKKNKSNLSRPLGSTLKGTLAVHCQLQNVLNSLQ